MSASARCTPHPAKRMCLLSSPLSELVPGSTLLPDLFDKIVQQSDGPSYQHHAHFLKFALVSKQFYGAVKRHLRRKYKTLEIVYGAPADWTHLPDPYFASSAQEPVQGVYSINGVAYPDAEAVQNMLPLIARHSVPSALTVRASPAARDDFLLALAPLAAKKCLLSLDVHPSHLLDPIISISRNDNIKEYLNCSSLALCSLSRDARIELLETHAREIKGVIGYGLDRDSHIYEAIESVESRLLAGPSCRHLRIYGANSVAVYQSVFKALLEGFRVHHLELLASRWTGDFDTDYKICQSWTGHSMPIHTLTVKLQSETVPCPQSLLYSLRPALSRFNTHTTHIHFARPLNCVNTEHLLESVLSLNTVVEQMSTRHGRLHIYIPFTCPDLDRKALKTGVWARSGFVTNEHDALHLVEKESSWDLHSELKIDENKHYRHIFHYVQV